VIEVVIRGPIRGGKRLVLEESRRHRAAGRSILAHEGEMTWPRKVKLVALDQARVARRLA
jgi:hypothetical protein